MKKTVFLIIVLLLLIQTLGFSSIGANISCFLPLPWETGYFSIPVPPLSFELGLLTLVPDILVVNFDIGLMLIPAYSLSNTGFTLTKPALGPSIAVESGLTLKASLPLGPVTLSAIGGGFSFYYIDLKLNRGNLDRDLMNFLSWTSLTSDLTINNNIGFGYKYGGALSVKIMDKISINLKGMYYYGEALTPISGRITGGTTSIASQDYSIAAAKSLYRGIKIAIGGSYDL